MAVTKNQEYTVTVEGYSGEGAGVARIDGFVVFVSGALRGEVSLEQAAELCRQHSRNYAKRQLTWFRRNPAIHWLRMHGEEPFDAIFTSVRQNIPDFFR